MSTKPQAGKTVCEMCEYQSSNAFLDHLNGVNPFNVEEIIHGCPECKSIDSFRSACDEPGCWELVSCGTPSAGGYRTTCRAHKPREKAGDA
ncbi:hypothetical protein LCGC14_1977660 [marine sediment metagenome]|uniref:Uncharacterized protein n=1 Tax=marine sediment metagenome TaxID=412755 RepID=A0A0F9HN69_9ZZZZ